jgi:hypothetical protein
MNNVGLWPTAQVRPDQSNGRPNSFPFDRGSGAHRHLEVGEGLGVIVVKV